MATYAVQFITREGAVCGQTITNRGRAMLLVGGPDWTTRQAACVVIVVSANSTKERLKMKGTALAHVFHERTRAMDWLKQLEEGD